MRGLATDRLRLPAGRAPGGLALVQELINTGLRATPAPGGPPDLLDEAGTADRWLEAALEQWAAANRQPRPALHLAEADLAPLRRLRAYVRALADAHAAESPGRFLSSGVGVTLGFDADGRVLHQTGASGWRGVAALVTAEILLAQHAGLWPRFKTCAHPDCGVAFYDESRNNSRVWHDVRTCGNRTNLANSRRRRADEAAAAAVDGP